MNYIYHALIGVGTASLGVLAAEALGAPPFPAAVLGVGAVGIAAGAIATDLDHPKSFISHGIPSRVIRIALAVLAVPLLAALMLLLTTRDAGGTWHQFSALVMGWDILRWSFFAILMALGLTGLSWLVYRSLHHRGPLHSLLFTLGITSTVCVVLAVFGQPWAWGLAFGWGWTWHILADGLTTEGVPFFWPVNDDRKHTLPAWACGMARFGLSLASIGGILGVIILKMKPLLG